ncbi:MAG: hypothetical protein L3J23_07370 [Flavobacteriaceae bacterium]|nr:hypothetical protein [Flavobacteriaceae bacterium]
MKSVELTTFVGSAIGNQPVKEHFTISPAYLKHNGALMFAKTWKKTNLTNTAKPTKVHQDKEPQISRITWLDPKTNKNTKAIPYDEQVGMQIEIRDAIGGTATIVIKIEAGNDFEKGKSELTFTEAVNENGMVTVAPFLIERVWEETKVPKYDYLVAKVVYNGISKKSEAIKLNISHLIIKGKKKAKDTFINIINEGLGGNFASYNKSGNVTLNVNRKDLKTDAQKTLFDVINEPVSSEKDTTIRVRSGDGAVTAGSFTSGIFDTQDIDNFGSADKNMNKFSILGHEVKEQFEKQVNGKKAYEKDGTGAHQQGRDFENKYTGAVRGTTTKSNKVSKKVNRVGKNYTSKSYTASIPFTRGSKTTISTYRVVDGNVIKRE